MPLEALQGLRRGRTPLLTTSGCIRCSHSQRRVWALPGVGERQLRRVLLERAAFPINTVGRGSDATLYSHRSVDDGTLLVRAAVDPLEGIGIVHQGLRGV